MLVQLPAGVHAVLCIFSMLVGAVTGSFLNVVIYRLPRRQSIVWPGSRCPHCGLPIRAADNIPVLSFLLLRGQCRECGGPIAWQYPLVEIATALLFLLGLEAIGLTPFLLGAWALLAALLAVSVIDYRLRIITDAITLPGTVLALAVPVAAHVARRPQLWAVTVPQAALGYFVGAGSLFVVGAGYLLFTGREGMGLGDVKLMGLVGAMLGWQQALFAIMAGSVAGTALLLPLMLSRNVGRKTEIPFGPFLALGSAVALLWGSRILALYRTAVGLG
jgi:leader peptidase (prepilin peptidase) / N-methyltransferase